MKKNRMLNMMFAFLIAAPLFGIISNYLTHMEEGGLPFWWTVIARFMLHTYFPMWVIYARRVLKDDPLPKSTIIINLLLVYVPFLVHAIQPLLGAEQFSSYKAALAVAPGAQNWMNDYCYASISVISIAYFAYLAYYIFKSYPTKFPNRMKSTWLKKRYNYIRSIVLINWIMMFLSVGSMYLWGVVQTETITFQVVFNLYTFYLIYQGVVNRIFNFPVRDIEDKQDAQILDSSLSIITQIKNQKLYLDDSLTVESLAAALEMPLYKLNQVLHSIEGQTFNDIINKERVEEFKKNIHKPYTIETIALESGFRSKSTFNRAFKKFEGITPHQYKKSLIAA